MSEDNIRKILISNLVNIEITYGISSNEYTKAFNLINEFENNIYEEKIKKIKETIWEKVNKRLKDIPINYLLTTEINQELYLENERLKKG